LLEEIVRRAAEELRLREQAIDEVMDRARKARVLSKQAILHVHGGSIKEAREKLEEAGRLLREMEGLIGERAEIGRFDEVSAAQEEYSEASIIFKLKTSNAFPSPGDVGVSFSIYLLGLGDVPGELRRQALDALRQGDLERAEALLGTMERIYLSLVSMEETPFLRGLRRKLDTARGVIERTRSELTAEAGRRRLLESVRSLNKKLS